MKALHVLVVLVALPCAACSGTSAGVAGGQDATDPGTDPAAEAPPPDCGTPAVLRVAVRDVWARPVGAWTATVDGAATADADPQVPFPVGPVEVSAASDGLVPARVRFAPDAGGPLASVAEELEGGARTAVSVSADCTRLTLWIGLDSPWFAASGRAPTAGNAAELLMDGEEFWGAVQYDLAAAEGDVRGTTWWWQSDFELVRPEGHEWMTPEERRPNTMIAILDGLTAVKRVLVNRFLPETAAGMAYLNTDADLRARATADGDGFEVLLQGNETPVPVAEPYAGTAPGPDFRARVAASGEAAGEAFPPAPVVSAVLDSLDAASWHQKGFVIDGRVAFVSGMNVKSTDWDTSAHAVFDSRRMKFRTSSDERDRVARRLQLPDLGPRKDYGIRVAGPAARDVDDVLRVRWDQGIAAHAMYWEHASPFACGPAAAAERGVLCQVVATMPPPAAEQSILETWRKALSNATGLVYIEDQYFRMPVLIDVMEQAIRREPGMRLVVVTKPISSTDGGKKHSVLTDRRLREAAPDRYLLLQLKSFEAVPRPEPPAEGDESAAFYFADIDTHSKILIVNDEYLSVGSCNKNNRGLLYEGELNVSVLDRDWVREARRRIVRNLVGGRLEDEVGDDPAGLFDLLRDTATANAGREAWWVANGPALDAAGVEAAARTHAPDGFVYPLEFTDDWLLDVGPDAF
ncbi:MAG: hypothetical protein FJ087_01945 [Deltaproteobacteria bacterium]|nr:hypothetical protein [Deltaproteobacteria bacterium]